MDLGISDEGNSAYGLLVRYSISIALLKHINTREQGSLVYDICFEYLHFRCRLGGEDFWVGVLEKNGL